MVVESHRRRFLSIVDVVGGRVVPPQEAYCPIHLSKTLARRELWRLLSRHLFILDYSEDENPALNQGRAVCLCEGVGGDGLISEKRSRVPGSN